MPLTYRPVTPEDFPIICGFPQSAEELFFMFPKAFYPLTVKQLQEAAAQRSDSTVVELDGQVAGFANFYHWESGGRCTIGNVIVDPSLRGHGVGRFLIEHMVALAFEKYQAAEVTLSCFNANTAGLLLYARLGFQPFLIEERQDKAGNRIASIHLRVLRLAD